MATVQSSQHEKIQMCLFSATIPFWVKTVAKKYLDPAHVTVDLAKELKNKTSKTVNHLAICVPFHTRTQTLADVIKMYGAGLNSKTIVFT